MLLFLYFINIFKVTMDFQKGIKSMSELWILRLQLHGTVDLWVWEEIGGVVGGDWQWERQRELVDAMPKMLEWKQCVAVERERERGVWLGVDGGELSTVGGVNSVTILNSSTWLPIFLGVVDKNFW